MTQITDKNEHQHLRSIRDEVHFQRENEWPHFLEGSLLESAVAEASYDFQVTREMAVTSALGAIAFACQGLIDIEQPTGNKVPSSLMLVTIAESGERKTTIEKQFFKAIREQQKVALQDYEKLYAEREYNISVYKDKESVLRKKLKSLLQKNESTEEIEKQLLDLKNKLEPLPSNRKFIYDDSTPPALVQGMSEGCKNACLASSEANGIFNGKVFSELHKLNTLWDGGDVIVDRVTKNSFILSNARLTLALMTQMSVIERFLDTRGPEARGMGFLARFLVVCPASKAGSRDATRNLSELKHLNSFNQRIRELLIKSLDNEDKNSPRETITFNASSEGLWRKISQDIENEMRVDCVYEHYRDHASKLMDNITRVAGIVEFFEGKNKEISIDTLQFAYSLCMRYSKHFLNYLAGKPKVVSDADLLAQFLIKHCDKNPDNKRNTLQPFVYHNRLIRKGRLTEFNHTLIKQYGPNVLRNSENDHAAMKNAIELLRRLGFVEKTASRDNDSTYVFNESLVLSTYAGSKLEEPMLKNGNEYTIDSLPLFDDLVAYQDSEFKDTNRWTKVSYAIKVLQ